MEWVRDDFMDKLLKIEERHIDTEGRVKLRDLMKELVKKEFKNWGQ